MIIVIWRYFLYKWHRSINWNLTNPGSMATFRSLCDKLIFFNWMKSRKIYHFIATFTMRWGLCTMWIETLPVTLLPFHKHTGFWFSWVTQCSCHQVEAWLTPPSLPSLPPFLPQANHTIDFDTGSALVLTIESTLITACSSESLVSKGHFKNFCIRFAEGFETSWDDWKPEIRGDLVMNACEWCTFVLEGLNPPYPRVHKLLCAISPLGGAIFL